MHAPPVHAGDASAHAPGILLTLSILYPLVHSRTSSYRALLVVLHPLFRICDGGAIRPTPLLLPPRILRGCGEGEEKTLQRLETAFGGPQMGKVVKSL